MKLSQLTYLYKRLTTALETICFTDKRGRYMAVCIKKKSLGEDINYDPPEMNFGILPLTMSKLTIMLLRKLAIPSAA